MWPSYYVFTWASGSKWGWARWPLGQFLELESLSKTTKLILLDSLLQEVCISSAMIGRSPWDFSGLSVCLSQSQTALFGAKESPLIRRLRMIRKWHCIDCQAALTFNFEVWNFTLYLFVIIGWNNFRYVGKWTPKLRKWLI